MKKIIVMLFSFLFLSPCFVFAQDLYIDFLGDRAEKIKESIVDSIKVDDSKDTYVQMQVWNNQNGEYKNLNLSRIKNKDLSLALSNDKKGINCVIKIGQGIKIEDILLVPALDEVQKGSVNADIALTAQISYTVGNKHSMFVIPQSIVTVNQEDYSKYFNVKSNMVASQGRKYVKGVFKDHQGNCIDPHCNCPEVEVYYLVPFEAVSVKHHVEGCQDPYHCDCPEEIVYK